ncbi:MAG: DUF4149 domain-containing protein [Thermoanaerobaculia bacterium]|jgi:general stress protein CsbA
MKAWLTLMLYAIWIGAGLTIALIAAPAAFEAAPSRTIAAAVVGAMLARWHYIALAAPAILLIAEWRRGLTNTRLVVLLSLALLLGSAQAFADLEIRQIRASSIVPVSELPASSAVRRRFGMLHGVSTSIMLLQIVAAMGAAWPDKRGERREARGDE